MSYEAFIRRYSAITYGTVPHSMCFADLTAETITSENETQDSFCSHLEDYVVYNLGKA